MMHDRRALEQIFGEETLACYWQSVLTVTRDILESVW